MGVWLLQTMIAGLIQPNDLRTAQAEAVRSRAGVLYETDWTCPDIPVVFTPEEIDYYQQIVDNKQMSGEDFEHLIEMAKCAKSIFYWVEHYVYIKTAAGFQKMVLYPWQKKMLYELITGHNLIVLKSRQIGCSWVGALYCVWMGLFHHDKAMYFFSVNKDKAVDQLQRVKDYLFNLPDWMKAGVEERTLHVKFRSTRSKIQSLPAGENTARGITANFVFCDEMGFWDFDTYMWAGIAPTISNGGQAMIVSTPPEPERGMTVYQERYEVINAALAALADNRVYDPLDDADYSKWKSHIVHYSQVPQYDDKWRKQQKANMMDSIWNREYELVLGEVGFPFYNIAKIPLREDLKPPKGSVTRFATGIDSSELKKGLDLSAIVSLDIDGIVADVWYSSQKHPPSMEEWAGIDIAYGEGIVPKWLLEHEGFTYIEENAIGMLTFRTAAKYNYGTTRMVMGWRTGQTSRSEALTTLGADLESGEVIITDKYLHDCVRNFVQTEKGKPVAAFGWKDDPVIALALANMARHQLLRLEGKSTTKAASKPREDLEKIQSMKFHVGFTKAPPEKPMRIARWAVFGGRKRWTAGDD